MRKAIYKAIADRLTAAQLGITHISLWNQQTNQLREQRAFRLPAAFVEFEPIAWTQLSQGGRAADARVRIHIVTESMATPEVGGKYEDKALVHLDFLERVAAAMQGLAGAGFNRFMLLETNTDHDHGQIRRDDLLYATHITDLSAVRPSATVGDVALII